MVKTQIKSWLNAFNSKVVDICRRNKTKAVVFTLAVTILQMFAVIESSVYGDLTYPVFDRYDKLCIPFMTLQPEFTPCVEHFAEGKIKLDYSINQAGEKDGNFLLSYKLTEELVADIKVNYFGLGDWIGLLAFLVPLVVAVYSVFESKDIQQPWVVLLYSFLFVFFTLKGLYYFKMQIDAVRLYLYKGFAFYLLGISAFIVTLALVWLHDFKAGKTWVKEFVLMSLTLLGFSFFLKFAMLDSKITNTQIYLYVNEYLGEFGEGQFVIDTEHTNRLDKVLMKIEDARAKFKGDADTLVIEGHSDSGLVKSLDANPSQNIDEILSDEFGRLKVTQGLRSISYNSNIELAYLRAYSVWNYIQYKRQQGAGFLKGIKHIYITSFSHHAMAEQGKVYTNYNGDVTAYGERNVVIRLEKERY